MAIRTVTGEIVEIHLSATPTISSTSRVLEALRFATALVASREAVDDPVNYWEPAVSFDVLRVERGSLLVTIAASTGFAATAAAAARAVAEVIEQIANRDLRRRLLQAQVRAAEVDVERKEEEVRAEARDDEEQDSDDSDPPSLGQKIRMAEVLWIAEIAREARGNLDPDSVITVCAPSAVTHDDEVAEAFHRLAGWLISVRVLNDE